MTNPRIVSADEALRLVPAVLRPGLRLLRLPGFMVVERRVAHAQPQRRRRTSRKRSR